DVYVTIPTGPSEGDILSAVLARRLIGGVIAKLPWDWKGELDYTWDQSHYSYLTDPLRLLPTATTAVTTGVIDLFRDINAYPIDLSPYLGPGPGQIAMYSTTLKDATLRLNGTVGRLPAGRPQLIFMLEHRNEDKGDTYEYFPAEPNFHTAFYPST